MSFHPYSALADKALWTCNPKTVGEWSNAANWDIGRVPVWPDNAYINNGGSAHVQYDHGCQNLYIAFSRNGTVEQVGGTMSSNNTYLGYYAGTIGTYTLSGLSYLQCYHEFWIGVNGVGVLTQTGTSYFSPSELVLGRFADAQGTYELYGGTLYPNRIEVGDYGGGGIFRQYAGLVNIGNGSPDVLTIGQGPLSNGVYELVGGELRYGATAIGDGGTGLLKQSGGLRDMSGRGLSLGDWDYGNGSGTYEMGGSGILRRCSSAYIGGRYGLGRFFQHGGSSSFGDIYLGNSGGTGIFEVWGGSSAIAASTYTQGGTGTLISKIQADGISTIAVYTTALLDGSWQVEADGSPIGRWNVITAPGGISGTFDSVTLPGPGWSWGIDDKALWVQYVPEPSTVALVAIGAYAALVRRRRGG
jgi:hypothetical protein